MLSILFITYEYSNNTFSGNGVYAVSQVRALKQLGHAVTVVAACPGESAAAGNSENVIWVSVPDESWGVLNGECAWQAFCSSATSALTQYTAPGAAGATAPAFDVALCVDWHAALVWRRLSEAGSPLAAKPWAFLNYRMFSRDDKAAAVVLEAEEWAARAAPLMVTLSRADQQYAASHGWCAPERPSPCLPPGIRADVAALPSPQDVSPKPPRGAGGSAAARVPARPLLACCVRLSPEKQPERFVRAAAALSRRGTLRRLGLQPLLLAATAGTYADSVVEEFESTVAEGRVERGFKGPADLAAIFAQTRLNFHPCEYDAYGMTVIEAASQGAPSIMHAGGDVGASFVLSPERDESFAVDLAVGAEGTADAVERVLEDVKGLQAVAERCTAAARSYDEVANARLLVSHVQDNLLKGSTSTEVEVEIAAQAVTVSA